MIHSLRMLLGAELRSVVRDTAGLVIPIALPLLILVSNSFAMDADAIARALLPTVLVIVIATIGEVNMPSFLAAYRKSGVLRRLAVTPLHPAAVLGAQGLAGLIQIAAGSALAIGVATVAFGVPLPSAPLLVLGVLLFAAVALFSVGLVIAALAPTANAAVAIGLVIFFGISSIGGMFAPVAYLPAGVAAVGEALPFGAAVQAVISSWNGAGVETAHLLSLGITTVVCGLVAIRFFRWT